MSINITIETIREVDRVAAKMVYDWTDKEDTCYRLYIEEKKSLEEIMSFFKDQKFAPRYVHAASYLTVLDMDPYHTVPITSSVLTASQ